jgi:hypothetical protein
MLLRALAVQRRVSAWSGQLSLSGRTAQADVGGQAFLQRLSDTRLSAPVVSTRHPAAYS